MSKTVVASLAIGLMAALLPAQEGQKGQEKQDYKQDFKEGFKPQKEHEWLRQFEGTWECTSSFKMDKSAAKPDNPKDQTPGARSDRDYTEEKGKGVETDKLALGGFWLMQEFKGEADGKPFEGHGMIGYDPGRKKYIMTWTNSMSPCFMMAEGEAETDGKTFTFTGESTDPHDGKACKHRLVHEFKDKNSRTLTFYGTDAKDGGAERKMGEVKYTRRN
jgi:hypothetical protein